MKTQTFILHVCCFKGCDATTSPSTYSAWLYLENPACCYERYCVCPVHASMIEGENKEEMRHATRYPEEAATQEVEGEETQGKEVGA